MHFNLMPKSRIRVCLFFAVIACSAVALLAELGRVAAQNTPDIGWSTNAHFDSVRSVSFSADSTLLASGSEDGHAKVWMVDSKALVTDVSIGQPWVMSVALYPPGDLLLTGCDDGGVRGWSISSGRRLFGAGGELDGDADDIVWAVAISTGGALAVASSRIDLLSPAGGFTLENDDCQGLCYILSLAFAPDGSKLASSGFDGTAKVWSVGDGHLLQLFSGHSYFNPTNEEDTIINTVYSVDFSPDGALVASSGADGMVRLWRVSDGFEERVIPGAGGYAVKFSADGKTIFTLHGDGIRFWRVADGQLLATFANIGATCLAVASNGKYFAYGRGDGGVVLARSPVWMESITEAQGKVTLRWQGGSGLYQVQARPHLEKGDWHKLGPATTNTTFTHSAKSHLFYRVQGLPNP